MRPPRPMSASRWAFVCSRSACTTAATAGRRMESGRSTIQYGSSSANSSGSSRTRSGCRSAAKHGRNPIPAPARVASTWTKTLVELRPSRMVGHQPPRGVQIVHLQHGIDKVDQRVGGQFLDRCRGAVLGKVVAGGVHAEHVLAEPGRRGPVHLRFAHHHLDVQPGTLLERTPGHGDDLDAEPGVVAAQPGHRGGRDVGAEAVRRGHPDDAGDRVRGPAGLFEAPDRRLHPLGHLHRLRAQVRQLPAAGRAGQHPPAQRLLQRGNPARHGGVVQPEGLRRRRELRGAGDRQEDKQVIGVRIHICNSAHKGCWFDH